MSSISLQHVKKRFGTSTAVQDLSLEVPQGELVSLLGPSGCGKTTTLRMIAGFIAPTSGEILFDQRSVTKLPPYRRNIGMVFQSLALFPHKNVYDNIAYGLKMRRFSASAIDEKVQKMLELVQLQAFAARYPDALSGGQRQRVAFARAMVIDPDILLLDEPFAALDRKLREEMQIELRRLHEELQITTVFVTHDQREAFTLSDRIAVLNQGGIEQFATANEIYYHPASTFISKFVGVANSLQARVTSMNEETTQVTLADEDLALVLPSAYERAELGQSVHLFIRPEFVQIEVTESSEYTDHWMEATVTLVRFMGELVEAHVRTRGGHAMIATYQGVNAPDLEHGQSVRVRLPVSHILLIQ